MAGRGSLSEHTPIKNPNAFVLRNGRWQEMHTPIVWDRPFSGSSLAENFADLCQKEYKTNIGLIPCADGGTSLDQWQPGELLFDHAVAISKLAQRTSTIAGVLWHQGESDCSPHLADLYEEKCLRIFEALKKELNIDVPFLIGGLGDFLAECENWPECKNYRAVNQALESMAEKNDYISFVSAKGLTSNPDMLHFNAKSLDEFGTRYFEKFKAVNTIIVPDTHSSAPKLSEMEKL